MTMLEVVLVSFNFSFCVICQKKQNKNTVDIPSLHENLLKKLEERSKFICGGEVKKIYG